LEYIADYEDKGEVNLRLIYDSDQYCARVVMTAGDEILVEHFIAVETEIKVSTN